MYIINPWIFYLISLANSFKFASIIVAVIAIVLSINVIENDFKLAKILFAVSCVSLVIGILIPSQEVCYKMLIASQVTVENVNIAKETIKEVTNYIIEAAMKIGE